MSIFDTSDVAGMGQSSVPTTGGVVDKSAGMLADTVGNLARVGADIKASSDASEYNAGVNSFARKQLAIGAAVDRGDISSAEGRRKLNKLSDEALASGLNWDDIAKVQKDVTGTAGFGKVIAEGTAQEQEQAKIRAKAVDNNFIPANATEDQANEGIEKYMEYEQAKRTLEMAQSRQTFEKGEITLDRMRREEVQTQAVKTIANTQNFRLNNEFSDITAKFRSGEYTEEEALTLIEQGMMPVENTIQLIGPEVSGDVEALVKPMRQLKQHYTDMITGKISTEVGKRRVQRAVDQQKMLAILDPQVVKVAALSDLVGPSVTATLAINNAFGKFLADNQTPDDGHVSNPFPKSDKERDTVNRSLNFLKEELGKSDQSTNPDLHKQNMQTQLNSLMQGIRDYSGSTSSPKQFNEVVAFLADPKFGQNRGELSIPQDLADEANVIISTQYTDRVLPLLEQNWEEASLGLAEVNGKTTERSMKASELVEPKFLGGSVRFAPKQGVQLSRGAQRELEGLNRKITPFLNRFIRMGAHLEGHMDYKRVYEQNYQGLFGEELNDTTE